MRLYDEALSSTCMDKIKREYHVKDEDTKDEKIKAEPGHHDKISMGLFPSDVKKESDHPHIKTEVTVKCESSRTSAVFVKTENTATASSTSKDCLKSVGTESDTVACQVAVSTDVSRTAGQRRGRSANSSAQSDAQEDEILFVKRRGAILR
jgi:hypothetical protein